MDADSTNTDANTAINEVAIGIRKPEHMHSKKCMASRLIEAITFEAKCTADVVSDHDFIQWLQDNGPLNAAREWLRSYPCICAPCKCCVINNDAEPYYDDLEEG